MLYRILIYTFAAQNILATNLRQYKYIDFIGEEGHGKKG